MSQVSRRVKAEVRSIHPGRRHVERDGIDMYMEPLGEVLLLPWRHLITTCAAFGDGSPRSKTGSTTWIAELRPVQVAAIAWDWVMIEQGVLAVENILAITSNVYPIDGAGAPVNPGERSMALAQVVVGLDWQKIVRAYIEGHAGD